MTPKLITEIITIKLELTVSKEISEGYNPNKQKSIR